MVSRHMSEKKGTTNIDKAWKLGITEEVNNWESNRYLTHHGFKETHLGFKAHVRVTEWFQTKQRAKKKMRIFLELVWLFRFSY